MEPGKDVNDDRFHVTFASANSGAGTQNFSAVVCSVILLEWVRGPSFRKGFPLAPAIAVSLKMRWPCDILWAIAVQTVPFSVLIMLRSDLRTCNYHVYATYSMFALRSSLSGRQDLFLAQFVICDF